MKYVHIISLCAIHSLLHSSIEAAPYTRHNDNPRASSSLPGEHRNNADGDKAINLDPYSEKVLRKVIGLSKKGRAIKRIASDLITQSNTHDIQSLEQTLSILDSFEICLNTIENKLMNPNFQNNALEFKEEKELLTQLLGMLKDTVMSSDFGNAQEKRFLETLEDYTSEISALVNSMNSPS